MKITCAKSNPPLGGFLAAEFYKNLGNSLEIIWDRESTVTLKNSVKILPYGTSNDLIRILENHCNHSAKPLHKVTLNHWLSLSLVIEDELTESLDYLNKILGVQTYLVGESLSVSDLAIFAVLYVSDQFKEVSKTIGPKNILRWMNLIKANPSVSKALQDIPLDALENINKTSKTPKKNVDSGVEGKQEGKFVELPHAEMGKVVVRFPPEASGYLHIGHAKAALLNQYYQQSFEGKLIMRFDDTNPAKENVEFEKVILEDVEMLEIKPDLFTHTSQYFDLMIEMCEKLLKEGKAFVDDTPAEQMKSERDQKIDSKNRNASVEKNLELWKEMKSGSAIGVQCCVRAKIDMQSANGCLRDPTIYRCKPEPHPRTGNQYKVYPTYDFACPIVDSIEGVTHVLRTMEYHDRDPQFYWFIEALGLRKPYIWEYSRLSMTNTVLSKRKLTWFVEQGLVDGWDDPRMPTVRGVLRRGMTVEALRHFIRAQGSSRSVVFMEWDKIWAINKKVIDPVAPRFTALETNPVTVNLKGVTSDTVMTVALHPKNPDAGTKSIFVSPQLLIDRIDADTLKEGENVTFINYGNVMIDKIHRNADGAVLSIDGTPNLDNKDYKKTLKITWIANSKKTQTQETYCVYFDHIISKPVLGKDEDFKQYIGHQTRYEVAMIGEPELSKSKVGDIIQLQRRGFFRVDVAPGERSVHTGRARPLVLFHIPDGHTKQMPGQPKLSQPADNKEFVITKSAPSNEVALIDEQITKQGDLVRSLKAGKAEKDKINDAVKVLLELKAKFKTVTGQEWKPDSVKPDVKPDQNGEASNLSNEITKQGDLVRSLKASKADKKEISEAVNVLLELKAKYKLATGQEWKPAPVTQKQPSQPNVDNLASQVAAQADLVRKLKTEKADKSTVDTQVKILLKLKADYKTATGTDWSAGSMPPVQQTTPVSSHKDSLNSQIVEQGNKVRALKEQKEDKTLIQAEVQKLLALKADYKKETGTDWTPDKNSDSVKQEEKSKNLTPKNTKESKNKPKEQVQKSKKTDSTVETNKNQQKEESASSVKKITRLCLEARKDVNLPEWYSQVITKSEMIEYTDISGCYIFRPWSFSIWTYIRDFLSKHFKELGVEDGYFPIFVTKAALEREKTHIADFAPEVAWVTRSGDTELAEPIAVRPTSETAMYPSYAKWIQSHRDLPIKINQWNNVVRWEFKQPQPFLRTREFLWQEGHTAFRTQQEAADEVLVILELYARVYEEMLAIPVIRGRKTEKEKFAGGDYTTTVEAYIPASGRAIQGATSHHLGQNFSKMFEIIYDDPDTQEKTYVYQNSWGITTRTIGVMILVHGDDKGLVLPPRVADIQVIVVPCGITISSTAEDRKNLLDSCESLVKELKGHGIRAKGDYRDNYSPGWKFNHWELKGVPIRVEIGPKDLSRGEVVAVRRLTGDKRSLKRATAHSDLVALLETTQQEMFDKATKERDARLSQTTIWEDFTSFLDQKHILLAPFCGEISCEDNIKNDSARVEDDSVDVKAPAMGAKSLCIPFKQPRQLTASDRCIHPSCTNKPKFITLFGRSY